MKLRYAKLFLAKMTHSLVTLPARVKGYLLEISGALFWIITFLIAVKPLSCYFADYGECKHNKAAQSESWPIFDVETLEKKVELVHSAPNIF